MDKTVKEKWLKALRSEKYSQDTLALRSPKGFCCLGVLCDVSGKAEWKISQYGNYFTYLDDAATVLPFEVAKWAGLDTPDPTVKGQKLSAWNDTGKNFKEIADLIEENL